MLAATRRLWGPEAGCAEGVSHLGDMTDFPNERHSKREIIRAGKTLRGSMPWSEERHEEYVRVFRIAYDWRNSHAYPMRRIRQELGGKIRSAKVQAITAARLKRMSSIRRKLARSTITLVQIQDLGGCRAIVESIKDINALLDIYRNGGSTHFIRQDTSYIEQPKQGGYRGHHLVLQFRGNGDGASFDDRRIEVQLRTRLQHVWATAVEAVGLVRGEDLKAGEGSPEWLRLFELMSSEFAHTEGCPAVPGTDTPSVWRAEIVALNSKLNAIGTLESLNQAFKATENFIGRSASYFLIQYDHASRTVSITGYSSAINGSNRYSAEERDHDTVDSVLVEVDKVENLREAYPNYYGDVSEFTSRLVRVVNPSATPVVPVRVRDFSWLREWRS